MSKKSITTEKTYKRLFSKYMNKEANTSHELVRESFKSFIGDKTKSINIEDIKEKRELLSFKDFMIKRDT